MHHTCCDREHDVANGLPAQTQHPHVHDGAAPPENHRHSGIGFHTPADVHYGRAETVRDKRAVVLDAAYAEHPERFVRKPPQPPELPVAVWINEPKEDSPTTQ